MGLFDSGEKKTTSKSEPWGPQQQYLKDAFGQAQGAFNSAKGSAPGDPVADLNRHQDTALGAMRSNFDTMNDTADTIGQVGMDGVGAMSGHFDNIRDVQGQAGANRTDQIVADAGKFINNDVLEGQIEASINDVRKGFDDTVSDVNAAASGSGNINSTRAGALEARALDDAQDRAAAISSGMRADAYGRGLGMANNNAARSFSERVTGTKLGTTALDQGMGYLTDSDAIRAKSASKLLEGGSFGQAQDQAEIDGKMAMSERDLNLVRQYMTAIGGSFGGTQTNTQPTASPFQQIVGTAATAMGAF